MLTHEEATRLMVTVRGKMTQEERGQLGEYLQREGSKARDANPCHCYERCEDDDDGVARRPSCRKR